MFWIELVFEAVWLSVDMGPVEGGGGFMVDGVEKPRNLQVGFLQCKGILDGESSVIWHYLRFSPKAIISAVAFNSYSVPEDGLGDMLG